MREIKLAIAIPSARDWKAAFGSSILGLVRHVSMKGISGLNLKSFDMNIMQGASVLPRARQLAVNWAKSAGSTHLLFIDDDMMFPADILDTLMSKDVDIISCNYVSKAERSPVVHGMDGHAISSAGKSGIEEIAWAGLGFTLIKLESVKNIPAPLFEIRWMDEREDYLGEDFYFCAKARSHGVKIYCDHVASQTISHIGDYPYSFPQAPRLVREAA